MPSSNNYHPHHIGNHHGHYGGKRRVEFAPTLDAIDSEHEVPSPSEGGTMAWDTETNHMLSYFLGGEIGSTSATPYFATSVTTAEDDDGGPGEFNSLPQNEMKQSRDIEDDDEDDDVPPPTPVVQHFYAGRKKGGPASTTVPMMAASLISGGPMMEEQITHSIPMRPSASTQTMDSLETNPSPISPAAQMGTPQENLMLPNGVGGGEVSPLTYFQKEQQKTNSRLSGRSKGSKRTNSQQPSQQAAAHSTTPTTASHVPIPPPPATMAWMQEYNAMAAMAANGQYVPPMTGQPIMGYFPPAMIQPQHHPFIFAAAMAHHQQQQQQLPDTGKQNPAESEEKRVKRLERNRESARKSRRRKKEKLETLEGQVNKLHSQIEDERQRHIATMLDEMQAWKIRKIEREQSQPNNSDKRPVEGILRQSGPLSPEARAVLDFQYNRLRQVTLPNYHKFLLWCIFRDDAFFMTAKEEYVKPPTKAGATASARSSNSSTTAGGSASSSKMSSKQIGEELFNSGTKVEEIEDRQFPASSLAQDIRKTWPLFCFEVKFSVDQEEKFLAARRKARDDAASTLQVAQAELSTAVRTVESLRSAMESVSHAVGQRQEKSLLAILTPEQTVAYQSWLAQNRSKHSSWFGRQIIRYTQRRSMSNNHTVSHVENSTDRADVLMGGNSNATGAGLEGNKGSLSSSATKDTSLHDICRRLNEVLRISRKFQ